MFKYFFYIFILLLAGCASNNNDDHSHDAADTKTANAAAEGKTGESVQLTKAQMGAVEIELGEIVPKAIASTLEVTGVLKVPNAYKAFVTPLYSGVVKDIYVHDGMQVKKGQTLAIISNPELLQKQQLLQQVNAQIALAEIEYKRQQELVEGNAAPLKRMQQAQTELATLRSQKSGLEQQLKVVGASYKYSSTFPVVAPISGVINHVKAQIGSTIDGISPIAEIVDNSELHVDLHIFEKDLPLLKVNQAVTFQLTNNPQNTYNGVIATVGGAFEHESKTVAVHADVVGNKTGLIDGMNTIVQVILDSSKVVPAVPNEAIVNWGGQDYIFAVKQTDSTNFKFHPVPISKGRSHAGFTQITIIGSNNAPKNIVIKNAFFVQAALQSTDDGHDH
ncbi:efflux RND transporter periplasmic adaptor subunit [Polluticaenibacter yanchengensis]|uniref:Efflux RND transporter periplasmic adaptor subunit n=1 Tax=Polluticaenibacter yanchengensis TaxID=3014562 RepID=A0ABT4UM30_9BACT|nr:efflux RND transporter periplasmic adaptor subunit [Chitinophagaceae bacterium LY-5]